LARRVRAALNEVEVGIDEVTGTPGELAGPVRVTAPTEFGCLYLIPTIKPFLERHPEIEVSIELGTSLVALERREADLAFRTVRPTTGDVVARKIPGRPVRAFHAPSVEPALAWLRWVTFVGDVPWLGPVLAEHPGARVALRCTDLAGIRAACTSGIGSAVLPEFVGLTYGLVPLVGFPPTPGPPVWMAAPRTSLELPRVRALWDDVVRHVNEAS
jgi:DNA-binding transcriptional LysR family regulator